MKKKYFLMNILCVVFSLSSFAKNVADVPVATLEYNALVDFYNATNGNSWYYRWDISSNNLHESPWYGVTVENGHVTAISLGSNNVRGAIPSSFSNLKFLKTLSINYGSPYYYSNDLSGTNLDNLSGLESLENLSLSYCNLTGSIPASWGQLTKLKSIDLQNNQLEGEIFAEIGNLKNLESINLYSNQFTSIPATIGGATKLQTINFSQNKITNFPKQLENLTALTSINVTYNKISNIDALLDTNISLNFYGQNITLNELNLTGQDIVLTNFPTIARYNRSTNTLDAQNEFYVYIGYNNVGTVTISLDGSVTIPKEYFNSIQPGDVISLYQTTGDGNATINFTSINYNLPAVPNEEYQALVDFYNATNGASWYNKWDISTNNLNTAKWHGVMVENGHIAGINLDYNGLSGSIPASFSNLKYLKNLSCYYNYFSTANLENLSGLEFLESLNFYNCSITGGIPASWGQLTKLKSIDLGYNQLTHIPSAISGASKLTSINLNNNKLTSLPKELENLNDLTSINVSENQILDIQPLLGSNVNLNINYQNLTLGELTYTGDDLVIPSLPRITRFSKSTNTFDALNSFYVYVGSTQFGPISMNADGSLTIPKQFFSKAKVGDNITLTQSDGDAYGTRINFSSVIVNLPPIPDIEYQALVDFYNATNGANWSNKWDVSTNNLNQGGWYGVGIESGHITEITLGSNNIKGTIPESFSNLKYLKTLNLSQYNYYYPNNNFSTANLDNLSGLESLESLILSYCSLQGSIPASWGQLSKIKSIEVNNNQLSGSVFSEIGNLKNLETVNFSYNNLTSIPNTIGEAVKLKNINLYNNKITSLPKELENITTLSSIDASYNQIDDVIPLLNSNTYLSLNYQTLSINELVYNGSDVVLNNLPKITRYNKSNNTFNAQNSFDVYVKNEYKGNITMAADGSLTIPKQFISRLATNVPVYLYQTSGDAYGTKINFISTVSTVVNVPDIEYQALVDFYNATNGTNWYYKWDVSANTIHFGDWYGVTVENNHIVGLNLKSNNIKGTIPASFSNLKYLKTLDLSYGSPYNYNDLSTANLGNLSGLEALETLSMSYCNLKGNIPALWGQLTNLKTINLTNNKLTNLPKELENLTQLTSVNLTYNQVGDVQAVLGGNVSLLLNNQTVYVNELNITGQDIVLNLPSITKYVRSTNTFDAQNNFYLYVAGYYNATLTMNVNGTVTIPKQYLTNIQAGDQVYLRQYTGEISGIEIRFSNINYNLPAVPDAEYQALVDFYNATNGANWWDYKWDISSNNLNQVKWSGVTIQNGHVTDLYLSSNNVKGNFPASFSNLKYLKNLTLYGTPMETASLANLSGLESLESLRLEYCGLSGVIPDFLGQLSQLKSLSLYNNQLTVIPTSITGATKLQSINFTYNKLTTLPKELENLPDLNYIYVDNNQIEDTQALFRTNINFSIYYQTLSKNELIYTGEDVVVTNLPKITRYNRSANDYSELNTFGLYLRGSNMGVSIKMNADGSLVIPKQALSTMKTSDEVYLHQNSGTAYGSIIKFTTTRLNFPTIPNDEYQALVDFYNATNGANWYNKWNISTNNINEGGWYGISIESGHITGINLGSNNIKGTIPASFSNLKYVRDLNLSYNWYYYNNDFSTANLGNLSGLESLETLNMSYCNLKGNTPASWGQLSKLKSININNNQLEGDIFLEIGNLKNLESINFSQNKFTGIPATIGGADKLKTIYLSNNKLTNLPKELESLTNLNTFYVDYNQIEDTQALLNQNVSFSIYYQTFSQNELVYVGEDVVVNNLPKITRYSRSKNDFSELNNFRLILRGSDMGVNIVMNADGKLIIPKEALSSVKVGDEVYLYQNSGSAYTAKIKFDKVVLNLVPIPDAEYQALVDFYNATNGPNWINKWNISTNNINLGGWYGISIESGHITGINLSGNNVKGTFPASFSNLKYLKKLDLSYASPYSQNDLSTANLENLSGLEALESLNLSNCKIGGVIPSNWSLLTKLKSVNLGYNAITDINQNFSSLNLDSNSIYFYYQTINRDTLEIDNNEINIQLPLYSTIGFANGKINFNAQNQFYLYVNNEYKKYAYSNNGNVVFSDINLLNIKDTDKVYIYQINGYAYGTKINYNKVALGAPLVDEEFEILKKINAATNGNNWTNKWDLSQNNLATKPLYGVYVKNGHVIYLNLANNNLTGSLPAEITGLKYLKKLNLENNKILGSIPSDIQVLTDLEVLDLSNNFLSGTIPNQIADLQKLKKFAIGKNKFQGTIPSTLSDFVALEYLDLSENGFDQILKKFYYDLSKTTIDLKGQKIKYNKVLNVSGNTLKVTLNDIVKYNLTTNDYSAKNSFSMVINNSVYSNTVANNAGEIIFNNIIVDQIPTNTDIIIKQTSGTFINTEFTFTGIDDKSNIPVVQSEYLALIELNNALNGSSWTNKWDTSQNNLHTTKWFGVLTYDGHIVSIDLNNNNVSGIIPNMLDKFPMLAKLNLSSNKLTGVEAILPSTIEFIYNTQTINKGNLDLNTQTLINDLSINKYEHKKSDFFNQTYELRINNAYYRSFSMSTQGVKLTDLLNEWKVPNNQKIELRQYSGEAYNSIISYNLQYKMGDGNLDTNINVLDIQTTVNRILGRSIPYFNYNASDLNNDTNINILDLVAQVNLVQNQPINQKSKTIAAKQNTNEVKAKLSITNGKLMLDTNGYGITSFEILLNGIDKDFVDELISNMGFNVTETTTNNKTKIVAYTLSSELLGNVAIANIKTPNTTIESAILANVQAQSVPVEIANPTLSNNTFDNDNWVKINNYPNPFNHETNIEFFVSDNISTAQLSIYDFTGKKVSHITLHTQTGKNQYTFNRNELAAGVYTYQISIGHNVPKFIGKMIIK